MTRQICVIEPWTDIQSCKPKDGEPCEYQIVVTCKGWYSPNVKGDAFLPDDREAPDAQFRTWKPWKGAITFEEALPLIEEFRNKLKQEADGNNGVHS